MTRVGFAVAWLVAALGCRPADAGTLRFEGPSGALAPAAPGDSLRYALSAPAVAGATSYAWSVTATPGVWTGLPSGAVTTSPSIAFVAVGPPGWDSVTFAASFQGRSATRSSNLLTTTWKLKRSLIATGPITVDSSAIGPISLLVRPLQDTVYVGQSAQLCIFWRFGSGQRASPANAPAGCAPIYAASFPLAQRAPSAAEQAWTDGACEWPACLLGILRVPPDALPRPA